RRIREIGHASHLRRSVSRLEGGRSFVARTELAPAAPPGLRNRSGLSGDFEHPRVERFTSGFSRPNDELEGRNVALTGAERVRQEGLALLAGNLNAASKNQSMPVHHQAILIPEVEMSDPQLLVDHGGKLLNFDPAPGRGLEFESAGKVQRLDLVH